MPDPTFNLPHAWGGPAGSGRIRVRPEDFEVIEALGVEPSGAGEHVLLTLRKRNLNTAEVAQKVARLAGVRAREVSYAGLKDRVAITTQTFSVHLPGKTDPDWRRLENDNLQLIHAHRHHRKLRRGTLEGNRFRLVIRDFHGDAALLNERLEQIRQAGFPNYFGAQRFGRNGSNLQRATALFGGETGKVKRHQRGLWLSAARSWLFNRVLAERVALCSWNRPLAGEVMQVAGGRGQFMAGAADAELMERAARLEVHPTGPLCGKPGRALQPGDEAGAVESQALSGLGGWIEGLEKFGLEADRRALRAAATGLEWHLEGSVLELSFSLVAGSYATSLLRELLGNLLHRHRPYAK